MGLLNNGGCAANLRAVRPPDHLLSVACHAIYSIMIHYDLICGKEHRFEGWFANSAAYDAQLAAGELSCPECGSAKIDKAIMAPNIAAKGNSRSGRMSSKAALGQDEMRKFLRQVRVHVEQNASHVGEKFPEEARKIHYGERDAANIYGDATPQEVRELREEGIEVAAIPWVDPEN